MHSGTQRVADRGASLVPQHTGSRPCAPVLLAHINSCGWYWRMCGSRRFGPRCAPTQSSIRPDRWGGRGVLGVAGANAATWASGFLSALHCTWVKHLFRVNPLRISHRFSQVQRVDYSSCVGPSHRSPHLRSITRSGASHLAPRV